jgi:hypothetical protein
MTLTDETVNYIRNRPNNILVRFHCALCGGTIEKQSYLFEIMAGGPFDAWEVVCDDCAEHPENIPARIRARAGELREQAELLEARALEQFETKVLGPSNETGYGYGYDYPVEDEFPQWMRDRLGLPARPICAACGSEQQHPTVECDEPSYS